MKVIRNRSAGGLTFTLVRLPYPLRWWNAIHVPVAFRAEITVMTILGAAARNHNKLERLLQRASVDACNDYGWVIPFTQIMLHKADPA